MEVEEVRASASEEASEMEKLRAPGERYKMFEEDFLSFLSPLYFSLAVRGEGD